MKTYSKINFEVFTPQDFAYLPEFEPPQWGDLAPRFEYFLASDFCFPLKITLDNQMVAIGASIKHLDTAWLACIITHPEHRGKGLGYQITKKLIETIDRLHFQTIYLIATDLGFPVYQKLGFELEGEYSHLKRVVNENISNPSSNLILNFSEEYRQAIYNLDKLVSGENREAILAENIQWAKLYITGNQLLGFYMPSLGDGLIVAQSNEAGLALSTLRLETKNYAIVPNDNTLIINHLLENGFEKVLRSRRMFLGKKRPNQLHNLYHRINGQLG